MEYPVKLARDEDTGAFVVTFPDFPGATFGDTEEEALTNALDAVLTAVDGYISDRRPIPLPSPKKAHHTSVAVPVLEAAKIALHNEMMAAKVTKAELGRRLHVHGPQVDRLVKVRHISKIPHLEAAFAALGKRLVFQVADAPPRIVHRRRRRRAIA